MIVPPLHPFRFYGRRPAEYAEGANEGHRFTIRLQAVPDDEALDRVGRLFSAMTARGHADPSGAWRWSADFAAFDVGERWVGAYGFLSVLADYFVQMHRITPIADVVFHGARDPADRWSRWSLDQGAPLPGPPGFTASGFDGFARPVEAMDEPRPSAAFDAGRAAALEDAHRQALDDAMILQVPGKVGIEPIGMPVPPEEAGVAWPASTLAKLKALEEPESELHVVDWDARLRTRPFAWLYTERGGRGRYGLLYLDDAGVARPVRFPHRVHALSGLDVDEERGRALIRDARHVYLCDLRTAEAKVLYRIATLDDGVEIRLARFGAGGTVVVAARKMLRLLDVETGALLDAVKTRVDHAEVLLEGTVIAVLGAKLSLFAVDGHRLRKLGTLPKVPLPFETPGGRLCFVVDRRVYGITNVELALEGLEPEKKPKPKRERKPKTPKIPVAFVSLRKPPAAPDDAAARASLEVGETAKLFLRTDGVAIALLDQPDQRLRLRSADGPLVDVALEAEFSVPRRADGSLDLAALDRGRDLRVARHVLTADLGEGKLLLGTRSALDVIPFDGTTAGARTPAFPLPSKEQSNGVMALPNERLVLLTNAGLHLLELGHDRATLLHTSKLRGAQLVPLHHLSAFVVIEASGGVRVGIVRGDGVRWIGKAKGGLLNDGAWFDGRDVVVRHSGGRAGLRIGDLEAAVASVLG